MIKGWQESSCNWQSDGAWLAGMQEIKARKLGSPNPGLQTAIVK